MHIQLYNSPVKINSAELQVILNRGVSKEDVYEYINPTEECVNPPEAFGLDLMKRGAAMLIKHIMQNHKVLIIVDADCDGYTSSALLLNYLYASFPSFVINNVSYFLHSGKQHGLSDCCEEAEKYDLVILPDAGSNDIIFHLELNNTNTEILILDHHEVSNPAMYNNTVIINNQLTPYPNKELSGVGVTWQFCRFLDKLKDTDFANNYLDLVALGNMADMMSILSLETKYLIFEGFKEENIKNPFIYEMAKKNSFSLNKSDYKPSSEHGLQITPMGAAFFIAPFVNAMVRSGTQEEKELLFQSMLEYRAFDRVLSTKRGHAQGEMERIVDQAIRTCTNVKNRQTKAQDSGLEHLEGLIEKNHMLDHKVLLFLLEPGEVDKNIAGLIANKFMAKYQRPVCILTKVVDKENQYVTYEGSARGYGKDMNFKDICIAAGARYAEGHQGAFGLGLDCGSLDPDNGAEVFGEPILNFIDNTDSILKDMNEDPIYYVDYIWDAKNMTSEDEGQKILEMANMNDYLGKDFERPLVYIKNIKVNKDTFKVMKSNTLKYTNPVADIIQFSGTEEEINTFNNGNDYIINAVCKCNSNEWNYEINPQLIMVDYEIVDMKEASFVTAWGF